MPDLVPPCQRDQRERAISPIDPRLFRPLNLPPYSYSCSKPRCERNEISLVHSERTLVECLISATSTRFHIQRVTPPGPACIVTCRKGQVRPLPFGSTCASLCFEIYARSNISSPRKPCRFRTIRISFVFCFLST